jgi:2-polyprenyl-3-methyl-5-hydroxy-6-metoxy-1,4-benzoquinol methylase
MKIEVDNNRPSDWFESLYASSNHEGEGVPWADLKVHDDLARFCAMSSIDAQGKKALVIGCGLGDDAHYLETLGFEVSAIDVSKSAIAICKERFVDKSIDFHVADLFERQIHLENQFDFIVEIYTIQALPPEHQVSIATNITKFLAKNGKLLVVSYIQEDIGKFEDGPPWPLHKTFFKHFKNAGLTLLQKEKVAKEWNKATHHVVHLYKRK